MSLTPQRRVVGASVTKPRNTIIACRKCHARKVKCSGGQPCTNCRQANLDAAECTYPRRVRQVKVSQSHIDELYDEIQRLRETISTPPPAQSIAPPVISNAPSTAPANDAITISPRAPPAPPAHQDPPITLTETGDGVRNPLLEDRPWFFPLTPEMPILIGEATDAAFATRFRQALSATSQTHIPRTQHVQDITITASWPNDFHWPTPSRARFLVKVALNTICRRYYLVQKSTTLESLEQAIRDPETRDMLSTCKLFALFALGDAYSTRAASSENSFPGLSYYSDATRMLRVLSEQPRIHCVEIMMMLSLYALTMNRRHTAYCMAGCAVRFAILMGLHMNVSQTQLPNRELQEHRKRVWWTAYILDRTWAFTLGQPVSIRDEDIDVDLPSTQGLPESAAEDFADPEYLTASLRVANLGAQTSARIYSRRSQRGSFSCRVQQALRDLNSWVEELPSHLRLTMDSIPPNTSMPIITLHLYFNQCLMLATRPIALHVLRMQRDLSNTPARSIEPQITDTALVLSEACIRSARNTYRLLTDSWINGSFPTFDYTYTAYLFSASIILAISSMSNIKDCWSDRDDFEAAVQMLKELDANGNYVAKEFSKHMEAIKVVLETVECERTGSGPSHQVSRSVGTRAMPETLQHVRPQNEGVLHAPGTALVEPSLQELLSHDDLDLRFLEPSIVDDGFQTFFWPDGAPETWMH